MSAHAMKNCAACGVDWLPRTRYQATRNQTCSRKCAAQLRRTIPRVRKARPRCQRCGSPCMSRGQSMARMKYCSTKCAAQTRLESPTERGRMESIAHLGREGWTSDSLRSYREKMSGPKNPAWKGGVTVFKKHGAYAGVRYVRCPPALLPMARKDGYVMEHRLLIAMATGRCLSRTEVVHHVDHNPRNNMLENLELWPTNASHKLWEHGRFAMGAANLVSQLVLELL